MSFRWILYSSGISQSRGLQLTLILAGLCLSVGPVGAHPLRGAAIHVTTELYVETQRLVIDYEVSLARLAGLKEKQRMDIDKDGTLSSEEQQQYLDQLAQGLVPSIVLTYDGQPMMLGVTAREMTLEDVRVIPMAGSLRLGLTASLPLPDDRIHHLFFAHRGDWGQTADYMTSATAGDGVEILENAELRRLATFKTDPLSAKYPDRSVDILVRSVSGPPLAEIVADLTGSSENDQVSTDGTPVPPASTEASDRSEGLLDMIRTRQLNSGLMVWALLTALFLGGIHALEPGHGKTMVAAYLVGQRGHIRHALALGLVVTITHTLGVIILGVLILYAYAHVVPDRIVTWLGFASGLLIVGIGFYLFRRNSAPHGHAHAHDHHHHDDAIPHRHSHSRLPQEITWGSLLGLGISGGLVPCPGALVILLTAMTLNRLLLGLALLACFSLGLALVLIALGVLMVLARPLMDRWSGQGGLLQRLPRISAALIICLGFGMAVQALIAGGIITINIRF